MPAFEEVWSQVLYYLQFGKSQIHSEFRLVAQLQQFSLTGHYLPDSVGWSDLKESNAAK